MIKTFLSNATRNYLQHPFKVPACTIGYHFLIDHRVFSCSFFFFFCQGVFFVYVSKSLANTLPSLLSPFESCISFHCNSAQKLLDTDQTLTLNRQSIKKKRETDQVSFLRTATTPQTPAPGRSPCNLNRFDQNLKRKLVFT